MGCVYPDGLLQFKQTDNVRLRRRIQESWVEYGAMVFTSMLRQVPVTSDLHDEVSVASVIRPYPPSEYVIGKDEDFTDNWDIMTADKCGGWTNLVRGDRDHR